MYEWSFDVMIKGLGFFGLAMGTIILVDYYLNRPKRIKNAL